MFKQLKEAVLSGLRALAAVRKTASQNEEIPGVLGSYVKKIVERAYTVTDEDIIAVREAGYV